MKSKFYWEQHDEADRPFDLPRRISDGINACEKDVPQDSPNPPPSDIYGST